MTNVLKRPAWSMPCVKIRHVTKHWSKKFPHLLYDEFTSKTNAGEALDRLAEDTYARAKGFDCFYGKGPKFKIKK